METLFRWSKYVDEEALDSWEIRLIAAEVSYTAEKLVKRKRWQLNAFFLTRDEADELRGRFGGGVTEVNPAQWHPGPEEGVPFLLKIRDSIVVTEAEEEGVLESIRAEFPGRRVLSFPPQLAFGTGSHPTTAGCLRFLSDIAKQRAGTEWSLVDLGCGSAILAIAAAKLGASRVLAVEIDELALGYARRNAERHGVADRIDFLAEDVVAILEEGAERFDVIAANLFSTLLESLLPIFPEAMAPNADVVVSGFLTSQTKGVVEAAESADIAFSDYLRRGKWVAARGAHRRKP